MESFPVKTKKDLQYFVEDVYRQQKRANSLYQQALKNADARDNYKYAYAKRSIDIDDLLDLFFTRFSDMPSKYATDDGTPLFTSREALEVLQWALGAVLEDNYNG